MRQILAFGRLILHNHRFDRQLYDYRPAATDFYCAVKKTRESFEPIYNYDNNRIYAINEKLEQTND